MAIGTFDKFSCQAFLWTFLRFPQQLRDVAAATVIFDGDAPAGFVEKHSLAHDMIDGIGHGTSSDNRGPESGQAHVGPDHGHSPGADQ